MRVYIATNFERRREMHQWREALEAKGFRVLARWLDLPESMGRTPSTKEKAKRHARGDLKDLSQCDAIICDTTQGASPGMSVEWGYAVAHEMQLWRVGPSHTIFHSLASVEAKDWEELLKLV